MNFHSAYSNNSSIIIDICTEDVLSSRMSLSHQISSAAAARSMPSSANLRGSQRLCVIFFFGPSSAAHRRPSPVWRHGQRCRASRAASGNKLQLRTFPGSVDFRGLMLHLSPFRINTSRNSRAFRIAFIANEFNSPRINTSKNLHPKSLRISTSKKHGGGCTP